MKEVNISGYNVKPDDKKDLELFLIITFGLAYTGGMFFSLKGAGNLAAAYMMILPAMSVCLIKERRKKTKNNLSKLHCIIFIYFISITLLNILCINNAISNIQGIELVINGIGSIVLLIYSWFSCPNLMTSVNNGHTHIIAPLIMALALLLGELLSSPWREINLITYILSFLYTIPSFALAGIGFFCEEYGWRGFLQEKLQNKLGKCWGVIILGIIWEAWHLPLWFGPYQIKELGAVIVIMRFIHTTCLAIFLGWLYMKTHNVWLCALIHYINNSLSGGSNQSVHGMITASIVVSIVMGIFILSKEYRKDNK